MAVFDQLGNKKNPGLCSDGITNVCEVRNQIHKESKEKICHLCKQQLAETIENPIIDKMTLESFLTLSINDRIEFMIKHKLRRNHRIIGKYMPDKMNKLSKARNMKGLDWEQITLGEIYFTYKMYLQYLKKKYMKAKGLEEEDTLLIETHNENQISEFFEYNTRERNHSERGLNFKIVKERPKNTTLYGSLKYGEISDIKILDRNDTAIAVNTIPLLTIKSNKFERLPEQIITYINNPEIYENETGLPFEKNKNALIAYLHIVSVIEGACMTNHNQAVNYVEGIMKTRKEDWEKRFAKIQKKEQNRTFEIAPHKRVSRAVEKIIITHNGDISNATDNCRGMLTFETIDDLQKGMITFIDTLKEYNRNQKDNQKKVTEVFLDDKYGNMLDTSSKASGYRDGKMMIKTGDGNVIELMLHLQDMNKAKNEGFVSVNKKFIPEIIQKLALNKEEKDEINRIIERIDPEGTKRGTYMLNQTTKRQKLPHIEEIETSDKIPADFIYNIYRNLPEYKRGKKEQLPMEKEISERSLLEKLQLFEREIYQRGYRQHLNRIYERVINNKHEKDDSKLKKKLL